MDHKPLDGLQQAVTRFVELELPADASTNPVEPYSAVASALHAMVVEISRCESAALSREEILEVLAPARERYGRSDFLRRCQQWPRGYQGDYETIQYLHTAQNRATPGSIEYYCEEYALRCPASQQHRNKVQVQARMILETVLCHQGAHPPKILMLACGSALELQPIASLLAPHPCHIVLNDADEGALEAAKAALGPLQERCTFTPGNIFDFLVWDADEHGSFDLILSGGLFDYLTDRQCAFALKQIYEGILAEEGTFFFTNIDKHNPYRPWMAHLANWVLIERDQQDLEDIVNKAKIPPSALTLAKESTSLAWLVSITKPPQEPAT